MLLGSSVLGGNLLILHPGSKQPASSPTTALRQQRVVQLHWPKPLGGVALRSSHSVPTSWPCTSVPQCQARREKTHDVLISSAAEVELRWCAPRQEFMRGAAEAKVLTTYI